MPDTKISALTAVTTPATTDEFAVNQGGASKKETLAQIIAIRPTVPVVISTGAEFTSTGVPTAILPSTHATDDILVLVLQSSNDSLVAAPTGYTQLGPQNGIGTGAAAGANRLSIFWKRDGGSEVAPTLTDTGDHTYGFIFAVRGCPTVGDPFTFGGNNWKFVTSTSFSGPRSVTHVDNTLVVDIFAGSADIAGSNNTSNVNADLTSLTLIFDDGTTDGTGGFLTGSYGIKADAGPVGPTTGTWNTTSIDLCTRIHFLPADKSSHGFNPRGTEVQTFIGSPLNVLDAWVKPTGARSVRVQLCDGGGGGSGGNITTTAAGGGGGGGGGYDEAFFRADDLQATATVKAGPGGAAGTALNQAGNIGVISEFDTVSNGPLMSFNRIAGVAATAAASADGGNGGSGSGRGAQNSPAVAATRIAFEAATAGAASGGIGGRGGSGTTAPTGGSPADWGGGGGESGGDTDAAITSIANGWSLRGGGGGAGGRTNTNISGSGHGGGSRGINSAQGASPLDSNRLPFGAAGGTAGGSTVVTGGAGGFPGGGGGGGAGVAGGFGGAGGHGCVVVTTYF